MTSSLCFPFLFWGLISVFRNALRLLRSSMRSPFRAPSNAQVSILLTLSLTYGLCRLLCLASYLNCSNILYTVLFGWWVSLIYLFCSLLLAATVVVLNSLLLHFSLSLSLYILRCVRAYRTADLLSNSRFITPGHLESSL